MLLFKKWHEWRRNSLRRELEFVEQQISTIIQENDQLRRVATQCAREAAGRSDETRIQRNRGRSEEMLENSHLLTQLNLRKERLLKKLGVRVS
jgi:hypothetical protein